jgi:sigma-B regulation protein RsbU (phosphoserine phosphatase)
MEMNMGTGPLNTQRFLQQENKRLLQENESLRHEVTMLHDVLDALRALQEVSSRIDAKTNVLSLLDRILASALTSIGSKDGSLMLIDNEGNELVFVVVHGAIRDTLMNHRIPLGEGIGGWVAVNGRAVMIPNVRIDPRFSTAVDQNFNFKTRSLLCVPITFGNRVMGVIQAINKGNGDEFNRADLALLGVVAQLAATAMSRAEEMILAEEGTEKKE